VQAAQPGLGRDGTERALRDWLGVRHVVWLGDGIAGDDTHGHVDDLARFVDPRTVVRRCDDDPRDENFARPAENTRRLVAMQPTRTAQRSASCRCRMPAPLAIEG
jgi:agmatine deiminase